MVVAPTSIAKPKIASAPGVSGAQAALCRFHAAGTKRAPKTTLRQEMHVTPRPHVHVNQRQMRRR